MIPSDKLQSEIKKLQNYFLPRLNKIKNFDINDIDNIIMVHEINENIIDILLKNKDLFKNSVFTFDDGLYSQYYWFDYINKYFPNNPKIFFISTDIIFDGKEEDQITDISCSMAHENYFNNATKNAYMTLDQIRYLYRKSNCFVGGHGDKHLHAVNNTREPLKTFCNNWISDFYQMKLKFIEFFLFDIDIFCTPYNEENPLLFALIKKLYSGEIIGKSRNAIEDYK